MCLYYIISHSNTFFYVILFVAVVGEEVISITYTVENTIMEDEDNFIAVAFLTTLAKPFYEIMGMVQKLDNRFRLVLL